MTQILMRVWLSANERLHREEGQTVVEYALIIGLVVAVGVGIFATIGGHIGGVFTKLDNAITGSN